MKNKKNMNTRVVMKMMNIYLVAGISRHLKNADVD